MYDNKLELESNVVDYQNNLLVEYLDSGKKKYSSFNKNNLNWISIEKLLEVKELIKDKVMRKPYVVIEKIYYDHSEYYNNYGEIIGSICRDIIKVFDKKYDQKIKLEDILIADGSGEFMDRYKLYVVLIVAPKDRYYYYTNSKYTKSAAYHLFTSLVQINIKNFEILIDEYYYDVSLPLICSSNNGVAKLEPFDSKKYKKLKLDDKEKLCYIISYVNQSKNLIKLETPIIDQTISATCSKSNKFKTSSCMDSIMKAVTRYNSDVVFREYNNGKYYFAYQKDNVVCISTGKKETHDKKPTFISYVENNKIYLKCCKISKCIGYINDFGMFIDNCVQINERYILESNKVIKLLDTWKKTANLKLFAIKSSMGTGKTKMIESLINNNNYKKILWITHRRSLAKSLYGSLKKYKFINYMEQEESLFNNDRVIVNLDSLYRITRNIYTSGTIGIEFNVYDLIVIDEIESVLSHFDSAFLKKRTNPRNLFNLMTKIMTASKKIILSDAHIGDRTRLLIEEFENPIVVNNNFNPNKEKTVVIVKCETSFEKRIMEDLKKGLNICIASMSIKYLDEISEKLEKAKIKYVKYTSTSDDDIKNDLLDVNNHWKKYKAVLYSPTIESGIDFSAIHFYKTYGVIIDGQLTCSQRAFIQMLGRIRNTESKEIICCYKKLPIDLGDNSYTFENVLNNYKNYENQNSKCIIVNDKTEEIVNNNSTVIIKKEYQITLYDKIVIYNEVEQLNKNGSVFMHVLQTLIKQSGYSIKLKYDRMPRSKVQKLSKDEIIKSMLDVNEAEYSLDELIKKETQSKLSAVEKTVLKKIRFKKKFAIADNISKKLMKEYLTMYLDKEHILRNFKLLFGYKKPDDNIYSDSHDTGKEKVRQKIIIQLINLLTDNNYATLKIKYFEDIKFDSVQYNERLKKINKKNIITNIVEKYHNLFFNNVNKKYSQTKDKSNKQTSNTFIIKCVLSKYNICFGVTGRFKCGGKEYCNYAITIGKDLLEVMTRKANLAEH